MQGAFGDLGLGLMFAAVFVYMADGRQLSELSWIRSPVIWFLPGAGGGHFAIACLSREQL